MSTIARPPEGALDTYPQYFAVNRGASVVYGHVSEHQPQPPIPYLAVLAFSERWPEGRRSWVNAQKATHSLSVLAWEALRVAGWPADPARFLAVLDAVQQEAA